jgi:DNA-binding beta-propeller fold protein YncE
MTRSVGPALAVGLAVLAATLPLFARPANAAENPLKAQPPVIIPRAVGFFDYMLVDSREHRLIVSHTGSDTVDFIDTTTGALERQLYVGAAHGIAIDEVGGRYFVGISGAEKGVAVIDRSTLALRTPIATPGPLDALVIDPKRHTLMADEDNGDSIWVISTTTQRVIATVRTPVDSDAAEFDPISDRVYQNFTTINAMLVFDPATFRELTRYSTLPATKPHGLAIDAPQGRLFAAGSNGKVVVLDMATGRLIAAVPIAPHADQIAIDLQRHRLYCASGNGVLSVLDERGGTAKLIANVSVPQGAHTIAVDPTTGAVWISYGTEHDDYVMKLLPQ